MFDSLILKTVSESSKGRLCGVPEGLEAFLIREISQYEKKTTSCSLVVVQNEERLEEMAVQLKTLCPGKSVLTFPAWDCLPYDRVSPHKDLVGRRLDTLKTLVTHPKGPCLVVTSAKALLQKLPPKEVIKSMTVSFQSGQTLSLASLQNFLLSNGYLRVDTVREPGEYALRGGLVDLFPSGAENPIRLDLFGDDIESITTFDPLSQRSLEKVMSPVDLMPAGEVALCENTVRLFRQKYSALFGRASQKDKLYEAISEGKPYPGMEHWLPFFYPELSTLFDYMVPDVSVYFCQQSTEALKKHQEQIEDHFEARCHQKPEEQPYHPVPLSSFFLTYKDLLKKGCKSISMTPFSEPGQKVSLEERVLDLDSRTLHLSSKQGNVVASPVEKLKKLDLGNSSFKPFLMMCDSDGQREKARNLLETLDIPCRDISSLDNFRDYKNSSSVALFLYPLSEGFETPRACVIASREIFGRRVSGRSRRKRRSDLFIEESSALSVGDLIVHEEHGVGRYAGLYTLTVDQIPHDCLQLMYAGDDKLFLPVENLDLITRFGGEDNPAALDKLGGKSWQLRREKVKKDLMAMAGQLIDLAAKRKLQKTESLVPDEAFYQEFSSRFPYTETEDQLRAIEECLEDFKVGTPMDRLVCGDVGFGKTEVALRAAAAIVSTGKQVALIAPTTLLARQHYLNFTERFKGLGIDIRQLSRFVPSKVARQNRGDLSQGKAQIVVGTHALLSRQVAFQDLGLIIVDEEQHFGVKQKEHLKNLKTDVHVLALSATPIPRTLQLSLSGVRDMSLMTTAPVDRLAVRTFVTPFDPVIIRDALLRERFRGGQIFFVCPRIKDIENCQETLTDLVPNLRVAIATGQMNARELEDIMVDFYDKKYDLLLSTNIVESGLDLPDVNTIIIHRADLFGLSQLYQLRGRVGRGKSRGYAYLTTPAGQLLSETSQKRLEIMQTLDTLGAGFKLASHDMDLRGAGNLLGDAQSGHVKEVGVELYQQMLEDAVTAVKTQTLPEDQRILEEKWTPQLNLGISVLIPENYVPDLSVRLNLYRRLSWSQDLEEIMTLKSEMIDRFGALPTEVENLLTTVRLKQLCRLAGVVRVDTGPKGATLSFYKNRFRAADALIQYAMERPGIIRLKPDQSFSYLQVWPTVEDRIQGLTKLLTDLCQMCQMNQDSSHGT